MTDRPEGSIMSHRLFDEIPCPILRTGVAIDEQHTLLRNRAPKSIDQCSGNGRRRRPIVEGQHSHDDIGWFRPFEQGLDGFRQGRLTERLLIRFEPIHAVTQNPAALTG